MPNHAVQRQHRTDMGQWCIMADRHDLCARSRPVAVNLRQAAQRNQVQDFDRFADRFRIRLRNRLDGDRQHGEGSAKPGSHRGF